MIILKDEKKLIKMRAAGKAAAQLLDYLETQLQPGISTLKLNELSQLWIREKGLRSATYKYQGFPGYICTSVNDIVCHGIPNAQTILKNGDIINIDVTLIVDGYHGDVSRTFIIGQAKPHVENLVLRAQKAMMLGIEAIRPGVHINVIGEAITSFVEEFNYGIVTALCGHGIGQSFHEDPMVMHHRQRQRGVLLQPGMTFTIEPMINEGTHQVYTSKKDGWSVYTRDGKLSAQFEHTIAVRDDGVEILTKP